MVRSDLACKQVQSESYLHLVREEGQCGVVRCDVRLGLPNRLVVPLEARAAAVRLFPLLLDTLNQLGVRLLLLLRQRRRPCRRWRGGGRRSSLGCLLLLERLLVLAVQLPRVRFELLLLGRTLRRCLFAKITIRTTATL